MDGFCCVFVNQAVILLRSERLSSPFLTDRRTANPNIHLSHTIAGAILKMPTIPSLSNRVCYLVLQGHETLCSVFSVKSITILTER